MKTERYMTKFLRVKVCQDCEYAEAPGANFPAPPDVLCPKCGGEFVSRVGRFEVEEDRRWLWSGVVRREFLRFVPREDKNESAPPRLICKVPGCDRLAESFRDYCGKHLEPKSIVATENIAQYFESRGQEPIAAAVRAIANGKTPCDDCGEALPNHSDTCVSRHSEPTTHEDGFKAAVIDALVVDCIYQKEHDSNPRKAIYDLCHYEQILALDPAVSAEARALRDTYAKDAARIDAIEKAIFDHQSGLVARIVNVIEHSRAVIGDGASLRSAIDAVLEVK